jgi:hypothetical protein
VKNAEILHRVKEKRNILHTIKHWKAIWIGHILCRYCLLKHVLEGMIGGVGKQGRRHKLLLHNLNEKRRHTGT